jgi:hypothetical protein
VKVDSSVDVAVDRECHLAHLRMTGKRAVGEPELVLFCNDVHDPAWRVHPQANNPKKQDNRVVFPYQRLVRHNFYTGTRLRLPRSKSMDRSPKHVASFTNADLISVVPKRGRKRPTSRRAHIGVRRCSISGLASYHHRRESILSVTPAQAADLHQSVQMMLIERRLDRHFSVDFEPSRLVDTHRHR